MATDGARAPNRRGGLAKLARRLVKGFRSNERFVSSLGSPPRPAAARCTPAKLTRARKRQRDRCVLASEHGSVVNHRYRRAYETVNRFAAARDRCYWRTVCGCSFLKTYLDGVSSPSSSLSPSSSSLPSRSFPRLGLVSRRFVRRKRDFFPTIAPRSVDSLLVDDENFVRIEIIFYLVSSQHHAESYSVSFTRLFAVIS